MYKLLILLLTIPYISLHASSAAADVKASHAASLSTPAQAPLMIPKPIKDILFSHPYQVVSWLRAHPEYRDAHVDQNFPFIVYCAGGKAEFLPILKELIRLKAIPHSALNDYLRSSLLVEPASQIQAPNYHTAESTPRKIHLQAYVIQDLIDLYIAHDTPLTKIHTIISQDLARMQLIAQGHKPNDPIFNQVRAAKVPEQKIPVLQDALAYVNMLIKERHQKTKEALDPVLLPELINVALEYEAAVPKQPAVVQK